MVLQLETTETRDAERPTENAAGRSVASIVPPLNYYVLRSGLYFRCASTTRLLLLRHFL